MDLPFRNRFEGGRVLAAILQQRPHTPGALILALPRGGVPVAYELALALQAELDVFLVRKLGVPGYEELAMGAIASGGIRVLNPEVVEELAIRPEAIDHVAAREVIELARREQAYRDGRPPASIEGREVFLVDDGLATGASMRAAARAVRQLDPAHLTIAVPVAARETCDELAAEADEVICAATPEPFQAVGLWYRDFRPVEDKEVRELLSRARGVYEEVAQAQRG